MDLQEIINSRSDTTKISESKARKSLFHGTFTLVVSYIIILILAIFITSLLYSLSTLNSPYLYLPIVLICIFPAILLNLSLSFFNKNETLSGFTFLIFSMILTFTCSDLFVITSTHNDKSLPWNLHYEGSIIASHEVNKLINPNFLDNVHLYTNPESIKSAIEILSPSEKEQLFRTVLSKDDFNQITTDTYPMYLNKIASSQAEANQLKVNNYINIVSTNEAKTFSFQTITPHGILTKMYIPLLKNTILYFEL